MTARLDLRRVALLAGVLLAAACTGTPPEQAVTPPPTVAETATSPPTAPTTATTAAPTADTVICTDIMNPPVQGGSHLVGDQEPPVPYSSTPPTSGWHSSGAVDIAVYTAADPLTEPEQVSVLEAGAVVVTYKALPTPEVLALTSFVNEFYAGRVAVTPYDQLKEGQAALTAWGTLQLCDGIDLDIVEAFILEFADEEPTEPGHSD